MPNVPQEIDRVLEQIRERVRRAEGLRMRGADDRELEPVQSDIGRLKWRLADLVRVREWPQ
jgi:hypothetical protein